MCVAFVVVCCVIVCVGLIDGWCVCVLCVFVGVRVCVSDWLCVCVM